MTNGLTRRNPMGPINFSPVPFMIIAAIIAILLWEGLSWILSHLHLQWI